MSFRTSNLLRTAIRSISDLGMSRFKLMRPRHNTTCFNSGTVLAMASACATLINRIPGGIERALKEAVIQLTWKDRYIDFACDQRINCLSVIQIQEICGIIQRV